MEDITQALKEYFVDWTAWCEQQHTFAFRALLPMHAGWKISDEPALGQELAMLLPFTDQGHIGTVDNRKIALLALNDLAEGVPILQIMQLRPDSSDPLGLDHVAFYCPEVTALKTALKASDYTWEEQHNTGHTWLSLWFGEKQREAKFFDHTSLDIGARELSQTSEAIKNNHTAADLI